MRFLKTLFWVLLAVVALLFYSQNQGRVTLQFGDIQKDVAIMLVIIVSFLLGLLPTLVLHQATSWNLNRKLNNVQRSLNQMTTPPAVAVTPSINEGALPPVATPIAVPPGVL